MGQRPLKDTVLLTVLPEQSLIQCSDVMITVKAYHSTSVTHLYATGKAKVKATKSLVLFL